MRFIIEGNINENEREKFIKSIMPENEKLIKDLKEEFDEEINEELIKALDSVKIKEKNIHLKGKFGWIKYDKDNVRLEVNIEENCFLSLLKIVKLFKGFIYKYMILIIRFTKSWLDDIEKVE